MNPPTAPAACLRQAVPDDAMALAELVNMAGEGMPLYVWRKLAGEGQSPWAVGQARARRESGAFSCRNAVVRVIDDTVVACLIGYPLDATPAGGDHSGLPPMFVPLQELEDLVPGTWYINVLATRPEYRGRGYGTELLALAESISRDRGMRGLSLIVADSNLGARRLYGSHGYRELAQRPMVKEGWQSAGTNWVLMRKDPAPR